MNLKQLFARATFPIKTPVWDAEAYLASRAADDTALGDLSKQHYVTVTRKGGGFDVHSAGDASIVHHFRTEVEARAYILRRWW